MIVPLGRKAFARGDAESTEPAALAHKLGVEWTDSPDRCELSDLRGSAAPEA
jgi:hypothetical protein